jgi:ABC-type lipoprotein release transport system permease subunit
MGMVAFYAGLLLGVLVGVVLTFLLSKLVLRVETPEMQCNPVELKTP